GPWRSSTTRSPTTAGPRPCPSAAQRVQQGGGGEELDAHGDGVLVDVEVALVQVTHGALARGAHAEAGHRAGDVLQVPGEVLAAEALFGALDGLHPEPRDHGVAEQFGHSGLVDDRGHAAHVVDLRLGPVQVGDLVDGGDHDVGGLPPGLQVQAAHGAGEFGVLRDHVGRVAGFDPAPGDGEAAAGVDAPADQGGHVGDDPGGGGDQVGGQVRAGGVPAGAVEGDLQTVARRGD